MPEYHPVDLNESHLGQPLDTDLYNRQGVLVAARGSVIPSRERLDQLLGQRLYSRRGGPPLASPLEQLQDLGYRYEAALDPDTRLEGHALGTLAHALRHLALTHPEVGHAMAPRLPLDSASMRQSLHTAIVAVLLARLMELGEAAELTVARAALSMNLDSHALQDALHAGPRPDAEQYRQLLDHPAASVRRLLDAGVADERWLACVAQHHENIDGSGYPGGLSGPSILPEARVLRAADIWCALLAHRHNRICRYPAHALRVLFQRERGRLDDAVMLAMRTLMGAYPPGTLVRLANRETAMVTRWFPNRGQPEYVVSLLRPTGEALRWPQRRHTGEMLHAIRDYTYLTPRHVPVDWDRVWSLA